MRWTHTIHYSNGETDERTFRKGDAESVRYAHFVAEYRSERGLPENIAKIVNNETSEITYEAGKVT
jgi:hypothetical protein